MKKTTILITGLALLFSGLSVALVAPGHHIYCHYPSSHQNQSWETHTADHVDSRNVILLCEAQGGSPYLLGGSSSSMWN